MHTDSTNNKLMCARELRDTLEDHIYWSESLKKVEHDVCRHAAKTDCCSVTLHANFILMPIMPCCFCAFHNNFEPFDYTNLTKDR